MRTIFLSMNKRFLPVLFALLVCSGCAHQYVMKLSNGLTITTPSKPKLKNGYYVYKDAKGKDHYIPQGRVNEIEPASMAAEENQFTPSQPKQKHWYWPF
jgi:hypothetical protein